MRAAMSKCVVYRHSLGATVLNYSCVNNLHVLFYIFKMFKVIESLVLCEVQSVIVFRFEHICLLQAADQQICKVIRPTTMCAGKVRKLAATLLPGKFCATPLIAQTLRWVTFLLSQTLSLWQQATIKKSWKRPWNLRYRTWRQVSLKRIFKIQL